MQCQQLENNCIRICLLDRTPSRIYICLTFRQPKALPPPKQQLCPAPLKPWPAVPWSGAAVSPPVPSFLEVMLQEAERETQVLTAPSQPLHHSNDRSVQHSKPVGRGKGTPPVSRCVPAVLLSGVGVSVYALHWAVILSCRYVAFAKKQ